MPEQTTDKIDQLSLRVREALREIPDYVRQPKDEYFAIDNLWKIEITSTCKQAVEYLRAVILLTDEGLDRPAAALSRSLHELFIRFRYLSEYENELPDWFFWQISRDYYATVDTLNHTVVQDERDEKARHGLQRELRDIKYFLGEVPKERNFPWKSARNMLRELTVGSEWDPESLHRQLIGNPSDWVHIYVSSYPNVFTIIELSEASFVWTVKTAMQLCHNKSLIGPSATEIVTVCDQVLELRALPS